MNNETLKYNEILLQRIKLAVSHKCSGEFLRSMEKYSKAHYCELADELITTVIAQPWVEKGKPIFKKVQTRYPKNFWEHFKEDHFPSFLKSRFPVKYKIEYRTLVFYPYRAFPDLPHDFSPKTTVSFFVLENSLSKF